ncbi:hypothetical protein WNY78_01360 [Psychroserpens sp. AS72]|uniref:hypothetical protein n=1 Tax=Psychroserpens sp. AS72 TaxID=3135775 RepID=UPI0031764DD8
MKKTITLLIFMLNLLYSGTVLAQVPIVTYNYPSLDDGFHFKVTTTIANETFTIPTNGTGYNYLVYWGDGGYPIEYSGNVTHTFTNAGTYLVELVPYNFTVTYSNVGTTLYETWNPDWTGFPGIYFNNTGDKDKIVSIEQWGNGIWSKMENAFYGCSNMVNNATDTPAEILNSMQNIFKDASQFDVNLGNWPVANYVTNLTDALSYSGVSITNYDSTLIGWASQNVNSGLNLGADGLFYCSPTAQAARNTLINDKGWTITGDIQDCGSIYTYIPDHNFEQALIEEGYDSGPLDNLVLTANINTVTSLDVNGKNISDLTGIEAFSALTSLICNNNQLVNLNVSQNTALTTLNCWENQIISLDLTNNSALTFLISTTNQITSLDLSHNNNLNNIWVGDNPLTSLIISPSLINPVTESYSDISFITLYTPNLNCIDVGINPINGQSNVNNAAASWTAIDAASSFSVDCNYQTYVPDNNFEAYLEANGMGNGIANDDYVSTLNINTVPSLNVSGENISNLTGIGDFSALTSLICNNNQLINLNLSSNTNLQTLNCADNQLTNLNISQNTSLTSLTCSNNALTSLNVISNTLLQTIDCGTNQITDLNVLQNNQLLNLTCNNNQLVDLDISENKALTSFNCSNNQLIALNAKSNYNTTLSVFDATDNPALICINVDDSVYSETNWTNIDPVTSFSLDCENANLLTYIPDSNFEQRLINLGHDSGPIDGYVVTAIISAIPSLSLNQAGISDLTGLEDFTSLTYLNFMNNSVSSIDVSQNTMLTELWMRFNQVSSLDVTQNINLSILVCGSNQLTELDLSKNVALTQFTCENNNITTIDIKNGNNHNVSGIFFQVTNNPIECINVDDVAFSSAFWSYVPDSYFSEHCDTYSTYVPDDNFEQALITLGYDSGPLDNYVSTSNINTIESLDVNSQGITNLTGITDFTALTSLLCYNNDLIALNVSQNTALTTLECDGNDISSVDLSQNTALTHLWAGSDNILTSLNLKNGNNANLNFLNINNTPNLTCVQVDTQTIAENWNSNVDLPATFVKDPQTFCSTDCTSITYVPDNNFEAYLEANGMGNGVPNDDYVLTTNINTKPTLSIGNLDIEDLTGIEDFVALQSLYCQVNNLTSLDLSQNLAITVLYANSNQLTSLNLGSNTNYSQFGGLNTYNNPDLLCINVEEQATADLWNDNYFDNGEGSSSIDPQTVFNTDCFDYLNTSIPDANFEAYLEANGIGNGIANDGYVSTSNINTILFLSVPNQNISDLTGIEDFTALTALLCYNNLLTALDVSQNTALVRLECDQNNLETLNIANGNNTNLTILWLEDNTDLTCVTVDDQSIASDWNNDINLPTDIFNVDFQTAFSTNCGEVTLEAKAYLQGAFMNPNTGEETLMRDDLRMLTDFPLTSPYGDGLTITPTELTVSGQDAIVDWIWVELRDDATNTIVIASQSALLQRDGDIVDIDGISPIVFAQNAKHYNVVINHRSHSGIITADRQPFPKNQVQNFMDSSTTTLGSNAQVNMNGTIAQWAGDLNNDGKIQFSGADNDANALKTVILANAPLPLITFTVSGYFNSDINLDGVSRFSGSNNDTNIIKGIILNHPANQIFGFPTFTISTQVPPIND